MKYKTKVQYLLVVCFQVVSFVSFIYVGFTSYSLASNFSETTGRVGLSLQNEVFILESPPEDLKEPMSFRIIQSALGQPFCSSIYTHLLISALWMILFDLVHTLLEKMKITKVFHFGIL